MPASSPKSGATATAAAIRRWHSTGTHRSKYDGYLYGSSGYHTPEADLRCVEWKTGKVMWSEPNMGRSSLLLVDGTLICLSEDGTLRILRPNPQKYEELAKWEYGVGEGEDPAITRHDRRQDPLQRRRKHRPVALSRLGRAGLIQWPAVLGRCESVGMLEALVGE